MLDVCSGFLRGYARGFRLDDPSCRRIMLSSDSITQTLDQQTERWANCKVPGARLYTVTRDVDASDGTQMTRGDLIVITERYAFVSPSILLPGHGYPR